jgi:hypothetical protein
LIGFCLSLLNKHAVVQAANAPNGGVSFPRDRSAKAIANDLNHKEAGVSDEQY